MTACRRAVCPYGHSGWRGALLSEEEQGYWTLPLAMLPPCHRLKAMQLCMAAQYVVHHVAESTCMGEGKVVPCVLASTLRVRCCPALELSWGALLVGFVGSGSPPFFQEHRPSVGHPYLTYLIELYVLWAVLSQFRIVCGGRTAHLPFPQDASALTSIYIFYFLTPPPPKKKKGRENKVVFSLVVHTWSIVY